MSEGFNDAAKTVMAHKIAGAVDECLTPFIVSIIRQAKAEAWDEGFRDGRRQDGEGDDGPKFVNPYREQEDSDE